MWPDNLRYSQACDQNAFFWLKIKPKNNAKLKAKNYFSFSCNNFIEKYEEDIESWFKTNPEKSGVDFIDKICVETAKACCAKETQFGPNCEECPTGLNGEVCSGNDHLHI